MHKQQGFVMTRGMMVVIGFVVVGFVVWLVAQGSSNQPTQTTGANGQPVQEQPKQLTPEQKAEKDDTQTKDDLVRVAAAVTEYVSDHSGTYPANDTQLDEVLRNYIATKPFLSPLTQNSYVLSIKATREQGVMNLERGTCNSQKNGVVPTENSRTYALLTALSNKSVYCIDV